MLGSPNEQLSQQIWDLIVALARPVVIDQDDSQFNRLRGIAMGTPLVPVLSNLAVRPMDAAILDIKGVFYARYNR